MPYCDTRNHNHPNWMIQKENHWMNDVILSGFRLCLHGDVDVLSNSDGWRQLGRLCSSNDSEESTVHHHLWRRLDILSLGTWRVQEWYRYLFTNWSALESCIMCIHVSCFLFATLQKGTKQLDRICPNASEQGLLVSNLQDQYPDDGKLSSCHGRGSLLTVQLGFANLVLAVIARGQVLFKPDLWWPVKLNEAASLWWLSTCYIIMYHVISTLWMTFCKTL